ncbi:MAG: hypothetical protein ABI862_19275 [Ilumatobacteraceae bacterium]
MKTRSRLGVYGLGVVAAFGVAAALGSGVGPINVGASSGHAAMSTDSSTAAEVGLSGLSVAADGYRLVSPISTVEAGRSSTFTFQIERADGSVVTEYDLLHERRMHLIVLSRNLVDYLHLHPLLDAHGTWTVELPALNPGSYRVYADFQPHGADQVTLATDVSVPGLTEPIEVPPVSPDVEVDGLRVSLSGMPAVGESALTFDVTRDGIPVVTEPYLGAAGHLVVIRQGDLGYLHVHPMDGQAGAVRFIAEFPTPGRYRLFFDFSVGGTVHTASFTIDVMQSNSPTTSPSMSHDSASAS